MTSANLYPAKVIYLFHNCQFVSKYCCVGVLPYIIFEYALLIEKS